MSETIVDSRMRYAKKSPEEQKSAKLSQVACLNEDTCSSGADANIDLPGGAPGGYSHTLPIRVCAAQRGRDFGAPDLERGIHFRGVF